MVAVEMALQLQGQGQVTRVVALDGLPQYKQLFRDVTTSDVEVELLMRLANQRQALCDANELHRSLSSVPDWSGRLDLYVQRMAVSASEKKDNVTVSASKKEDNSTVSASEREDNLTVSASEREDSKTVSASEKEDNVTVGTSEREDNSTVSASEKEDSKTASASEREDNTFVSASEREDNTTVSASEREDSKTVSASEKEDDVTVSASEREAISSWRWRCHLLLHHALHDGRAKLRHDVTVIAARSGVIHEHRGDETYGFQTICEKKVEVVKVDGDHLTFLLRGKSQVAVAGHINALLQRQQQQQHQQQ